jgi:beta-lactam-binding protein with PASTA domain
LGDVISQDQIAGTEVEVGSSVAVLVSLGTNIVTVPSVIGMTEVEATSALGAVFLVVGDVTSDYSITIPAGKIMTQDPVADTEVVRESAVDIVISLGLPILAVPNLTGMTLVEADVALAEVGLLRGKTTGVFLGPELPAPIVKSQYPAALTEVVWGTIVDTHLNLGTRTGIQYAFEIY